MEALEHADLGALTRDGGQAPRSGRSELRRRRGHRLPSRPGAADPGRRRVGRVEARSWRSAPGRSRRSWPMSTATAGSSRPACVPTRVIESADHFEPWMMGVDDPGARDTWPGSTSCAGPTASCGCSRTTSAPRPASPTCWPRAGRRGPPICPWRHRRHGATRRRRYDMLGQTLRDAAPAGGEDPLGGPALRRAAEQRLVGARARSRGRSASRWSPATSLFSRGGRLRAEVDGHAATGGRGLPPHRRGPPARTTTAEPPGSPTLLLEPLRRGTLAVVNPLGCGVADDKLVHAYVEEMVRFYLGEEPLLRSVPTLRPRRPRGARRALLADRRAGGQAAQRAAAARASWSAPTRSRGRRLRQIARRVTDSPQELDRPGARGAVDPSDGVRRPARAAPRGPAPVRDRRRGEVPSRARGR